MSSAEILLSMLSFNFFFFFFFFCLLVFFFFVFFFSNFNLKRQFEYLDKDGSEK